MPSKPRAPIAFLATGRPLPIDAGAMRGGAPPLPIALSHGRLRQSVGIGAERGGGMEVRLTAVPGEDLVVLELANGPALVLHPENALLLLKSQARPGTDRGVAPREEAPFEVRLPAQLEWSGLARGTAGTRGATRSLGGVLVSAVHVITDLFQEPAADLVTTEVVKRMDGQVDPGLFSLSPDSLPVLKGTSEPLNKPPAIPDGDPLLVLVHGTFSNTSGTFGKLWTQHPERVTELFNRYQGRVYGLEHPTLGVSPIANALMLAKALPRRARVHLVTHSRGGLVAEVLARVAAAPLTPADLERFAGKDYADQRKQLEELAVEVQRKGVRVERVVRVACPARGTLLASKRLDAYLSVFKWTLELAGIPVVPALVDFLGEVARRRADPSMLPGLAAQIPDSPLIRWLHSVEEPIPGELRVVAGDIAGDSVSSWLKTLLADAFYWTDNDLVVQTRSMYGGAPRARGATFLFDRGGKVSHFAYFSNDRTAEAVVNGLIRDDAPGFRTIGPLTWAGQSSTGYRARPVTKDTRPAAERPAAFILPGILGSNLKADGRRIWLGWRLIDGLGRLDYRKARKVEPDGPIEMVYEDLGRFLAETHEVIEFAFDWRVPIEQEARRLAGEVARALDARAASGRPVRLLAHSMGGIVARVMQLERRDVWARLMSVPGARLLMLGTPNGGSWAPMQVLSGDDTFGNALAMCGAPFHEQEARQVMAGFPGFLQLQAGLTDPSLGLGREEDWRRLAEQDLRREQQHSLWHALGIQRDAYTWGVPAQAVLDQALHLRKRLDAQRDGDLQPFTDRMLLVVGKARFTPDGYDVGSDGLAYLDARDHGDGRVTLTSAQLPGVRTWQVECDHSSLPRRREAFDAYLELLETGTTSRLKVVAGAVRGAAPAAPAHVRSRPSRARFEAPPPEDPGDLLASASPDEPVDAGVADLKLAVAVHNGNLAFVREPFMLGHYRSVRLTGTEWVMDRLVGNGMSAALKAGLYPDAVGSCQVFVNTRAPADSPSGIPRPEAVIVVGLGPEGALRSSELTQTVRQGVIAWAQRLTERPGGWPATFEVAAALIGSSGGISAGEAARLIAQGVREANERMDRRWPRAGHLHFVELYLDRAAEAWRELKLLEAAESTRYRVMGEVQIGAGAQSRPVESNYRGTPYDYLSALSPGSKDADGEIEYTLYTRRARNEVRAQHTQGRLVRQLVTSASNSANRDTQIGNTLFRLLVPVEMEPFFIGSSEMLIGLDGSTAGIPWELLDPGSTGDGKALPWAIRARLLRKLHTETFRDRPLDASRDAWALVIGEPACPDEYPPLPAAREEAKAVAGLLRAPDKLGAERVTLLVGDDPEARGPDAMSVINALLHRGHTWRIVHIAGHGAPPEDTDPEPKDGEGRDPGDSDPRGVVLSGGNFLGPREIQSLRTVPELVFVNCCYLAARNPSELLNPPPPYNRAEFASGVAVALIELGVRCVIAAGWAVEDGPARVFATTFYEALLDGRRFSEAVASAREKARDAGGEGSNTWAAYQCYGDPDWTLQREGADAQAPSRPIAEEFTGVASSTGLVLALENLAVDSTYRKEPKEQEAQHMKIRHLEARFKVSMGMIGKVAEAFGHAWSEAGDREKAIGWYRAALAANDGTASLRASEQLGNLLARHAWEAVGMARDRLDALRRGSRKARDASARQVRSRAERKLRAAARAADGPVREAIALLETLVGVQRTMEREGLLAAAYKRQAMIARVTGRKQVEARALDQMLAHYRESLRVGREAQLPDLYYPALNVVGAELVNNARKGRLKALDPGLVQVVQQSLAARALADQDFPAAASAIELRFYQAIANRGLAAAAPSIEKSFRDLHLRVGAPRWWGSVRDQARFVLPYVRPRMSDRESRAAERLLELLIEFAPFAGSDVKAGPGPKRGARRKSNRARQRRE
jgi:hypothetical protein